MGIFCLIESECIFWQEKREISTIVIVKNSSIVIIMMIDDDDDDDDDEWLSSKISIQNSLEKGGIAESC